MIDTSDGFYRSPIDKKYRSRMNIPFRIQENNEELEAKFVKESIARGMISLKGHRYVFFTQDTFFCRWKMEFDHF